MCFLKLFLCDNLLSSHAILVAGTAINLNKWTALIHYNLVSDS